MTVFVVIDLLKYFFEHSNQFFAVVNREDHRWLEFEDISIFAFSAHQNLLVLETTNHIFGDKTSRLFRLPIGDDLNPEEHSLASDVANDVILALQRKKLLFEKISYFYCFLSQLFLLYDIKNCVGDGQRYWVSAVLSID